MKKEDSDQVSQFLDRYKLTEDIKQILENYFCTKSGEQNYY